MLGFRVCESSPVPTPFPHRHVAQEIEAIENATDASELLQAVPGCFFFFFWGGGGGGRGMVGRPLGASEGFTSRGLLGRLSFFFFFFFGGGGGGAGFVLPSGCVCAVVFFPFAGFRV